MARFSLQPLDRTADKQAWLDLLKDCQGGTLFHSPDFLGYHGSRFNECHQWILKGERPFGILPLAIADKTARSPYGASYGGMIFDRAVKYSEAAAISGELLKFLGERDVQECYLTPPLPCYYERPSETLVFSLLESGFVLHNSDVSSIVSLAGNLYEQTYTSNARNMMRKAEAAGVRIQERASLQDFWGLMDMTFQRHGVPPTHTFAEFKALQDSLPQQVHCDVAYIEELPVAGMACFEVNKRVITSFYLCSSPEHKDSQALSLLVGSAIQKAKDKGYSYFDFGTSSINMKARPGVFRFKESFGAVSQFRHTLRWEKH